MPQAPTKQQAHELIDRLSTGQVSAVVRLLEAMLDPVSIALANAPFDDEPVSEEEVRDIAEARAAYARGEVVSDEEVLAEFGLKAGDFGNN
jgi:non-canonical (house-cleaning) NTP pyrophosphatase